MKTNVLKPGLLVSLNTALRGGVNYRRVDIEPEHKVGDTLRARWETTKEIEDPAEFERAANVRSEARSQIARVCCASAFGLLCPIDREDDLQVAIEAARDLAMQHNRTAQRSQVSVYVLVGRIAQDDAEAARALGAEMRQLLDTMQAGIKAADPEMIREAANKARALGGMLTDRVGQQVTEAITEARRAARELVKRVEKSGQDAADVVAVCKTQAIESARFAFLDMEQGEVQSEAPAARGLDLPAEPREAAPAMMALPFALEVQ